MILFCLKSIKLNKCNIGDSHFWTIPEYEEKKQNRIIHTLTAENNVKRTNERRKVSNIKRDTKTVREREREEEPETQQDNQKNKRWSKEKSLFLFVCCLLFVWIVDSCLAYSTDDNDYDDDDDGVI